MNASRSWYAGFVNDVPYAGAVLGVSFFVHVSQRLELLL